MSGALNHTPADVIRELLVDLSLGSEPSDALAWPAYCEHMPDKGAHAANPDNVIVVYTTAGTQGGAIQIDGETPEKRGIQVTVRSNDTGDAYVKAAAILRQFDVGVNRATVIVGTHTYMVHSIQWTSPPIRLPPDGRRFLFSCNALAAITQTIVGT